MTRTFRYVRPDRDLAAVESWCERNGTVPRVLERGPDGLVRGISEVVEEGEERET